MSIAAAIDKELRAAGCIIHGVSLGREDDKATWRIDWVAEPTLPLVTQAQAIIDAFDIAAVVAPKGELELLIEHLVAKGIVRAEELPPELQALAAVPVAEAQAWGWVQAAIDWLLGR